MGVRQCSAPRGGDAVSDEIDAACQPAGALCAQGLIAEQNDSASTGAKWVGCCSALVGGAQSREGGWAVLRHRAHHPQTGSAPPPIRPPPCFSQGRARSTETHLNVQRILSWQ